MKLLVTGGCGFLGSNLASHGINEGYDVCILDNLQREGSRINLEWLKTQGKFNFFHADIRNSNDVERIIAQIKPDVIFHLAGQVAMTTSIENPRMDFETNALGTLNVLESVRKHAPKAGIIYSSTNKVYGDLEQYTYLEGPQRYSCIEKPNGFDEDTPLDFQSPYGCSKGAADQYLADYHRIYGINTVIFRHSSMYGGRQFATYDQGWVGWFCQKGIESKTKSSHFTISGNGKQVRDVLHAEDMVSLYFSALKRIEAVAGQKFNIGGGIANSLSLLELFDIISSITKKELHYKNIAARESDQRIFVADIAKAAKLLEWTPKVDKKKGVSNMLDWIEAMEKSK